MVGFDSSIIQVTACEGDMNYERGEGNLWVTGRDVPPLEGG